MSQNTTILSQKESSLLENLIYKYGLIVNFNQVQLSLNQNYSRQQVRNLAAKLTRNGWLVRIKKGVYYITNLESRGFAGVSVLVIARTLLAESYISFEAALQYHRIFDQHVQTVSSVCRQKHAAKTIQGITYRFIKTSAKNYYGWEETLVDGQMVKIATLEKAILDMIRSQRSIHTLDVVREKLIEYKNNFDFAKLNKFTLDQSITVRKILGFLLDQAGLDSVAIHNSLRNVKGASRMTRDSQLYSAKWHLYYHHHFA